MTDDDFRQIETELGISLPDSYCELHRHQADRLKIIDWFGGAITYLYLEPEHVIAANLEERPPDMGTGCAFPNWWESFFMVGTNGGGDYYCLRLDGTEGVWLIGSDCGDTPTRVADTFQEYVDGKIADYEADQKRKAEAAKRQMSFAEETSAHLEAIARDDGPESARKWMQSKSGYAMFQRLETLTPKVSPRKLRLYGIACCGLISDLENDDDCAAALALARQMTLGTVPEDEITHMRSRLREKVERLQGQSQSMDPILREVLGNPFHPVPFLAQWRTPKVMSLAETIFNDERFELLPELAGALLEAGCEDERIRTHCLRPNAHVRGCWVLDEVLNKEPDRVQSA